MTPTTNLKICVILFNCYRKSWEYILSSLLSRSVSSSSTIITEFRILARKFIFLKLWIFKARLKVSNFWRQNSNFRNIWIFCQSKNQFCMIRLSMLVRLDWNFSILFCHYFQLGRFCSIQAPSQNWSRLPSRDLSSEFEVYFQFLLQIERPQKSCHWQTLCPKRPWHPLGTSKSSSCGLESSSLVDPIETSTMKNLSKISMIFYEMLTTKSLVVPTKNLISTLVLALIHSMASLVTSRLIVTSSRQRVRCRSTSNPFPPGHHPRFCLGPLPELLHVLQNI